MKIAKTTEEAWEIQERFVEPGVTNAYAWLQWKGTEVCMDFQCKCGSDAHIDDDFVYHIKCSDCGKVYFVNGHVELIELEVEPKGSAIKETKDYWGH